MCFFLRLFWFLIFLRYQIDSVCPSSSSTPTTTSSTESFTLTTEELTSNIITTTESTISPITPDALCCPDVGKYPYPGSCTLYIACAIDYEPVITVSHFVKYIYAENNNNKFLICCVLTILSRVGMARFLIQILASAMTRKTSQAATLTRLPTTIKSIKI